MRSIEHLKRDVKVHINKLEKYYEFYGYHISDPVTFNDLMAQLVSQTEKVYITVTKYRSLMDSYKLSQKSKIANNLRKLYKETTFDQFKVKSRHYIFQNRIITPLIVANVKTREDSIPKEFNLPDDQSIEAKFEDLNISEELKMKGQPLSTKVPSTSLDSPTQKRTYLEMNKSTLTNFDIFSAGMLNVIFSYSDYLFSTSIDNDKFFVIGHFAVVLYEIKETELAKIHDMLLVKMTVDKLKLRIIKPYNNFYNTMIRVCLKFGIKNLPHLNFIDYMNSVQYHLGKKWNPNLNGPGEFFLKCCKEASKETKDKIVIKFFESLKTKLMKVWDIEIIKTSSKFKRVKTE